MTLITAALLALASAAQAQQAPPVRPNIVLIVADDLGYGDLASYGAPDIRTPNLDRLAQGGVRLTSYYANAPVCTPTRAALMTGRYQQRVGLERPLDTSRDLDRGLPATGQSLPQLLKNAGYATALVGKWHLGFKPEYRPMRHGFDEFWGYLAGYIDWYTHVRGDGQPDLWENDTPVAADGYFDHDVTDRAVKYIAAHAGRPFFLAVNHGWPHWPFQSPAASSVADRRNNSMLQQPADPRPPTRKDYAAIVEDGDRGIGRLLDALDRHGVSTNTLVIFISDNGGEWLSRNAPFRHRKDTLWEGGLRAPAIVRWPGVVRAGTVSSHVAVTMDLTATMLAAAGADAREARLEGIDLRPMLTGGPAAPDRTLFWRNLTQRAARWGNWKLLLDGNHQLVFDVVRDPGEQNDLTALHPEIAARLKPQIEAWEKDVDAEARALKR